MKVTKILGPAGCGKTTKNLEILMELIERGISPSEILFTTFTRAGAYHARDLVLERMKVTQDHLPYFRTLHSIVFRELSGPVMMTHNHLWMFAKKHGYPFTMASALGDVMGGSVTRGDHLLNIVNLAKNRRTPLKEAWLDYGPGIAFAFDEVALFSEQFENFKRSLHISDFTDILVRYADQKDIPPLGVKAAIIDEAQDLTRLQHDCLEKMTAEASELYFSGDDDQAIYSYSGADPDLLIDLEAQETVVLGQSYRIPKRVHQAAEAITRLLRKRLSKPYAPREERGELRVYHPLEHIDPPIHEALFILVRNNCFIKAGVDFCIERGIPFVATGEQPIREKAFRAIGVWKKISNGGSVSLEEFAICAEFMKVRDGIAYGFKKLLREELREERKAGLLSYQALREGYGLRAPESAKWDQALASLTLREKVYFRSVESKYKEIPDRPMCEIMTIHSAKGREADNVVVLPDMSLLTFKAYQEDPDNEHRVFYVATTRARKRLWITEPRTKRFYSYPKV